MIDTEALREVARLLRKRADKWRVDPSQNRNNWADLLESIAEDIESVCTPDSTTPPTTSSSTDDPSQPEV